MAESLTRGMRVIVSGRLRQRSYETKEGELRTVYEVEADDVGLSLRNASAKVNKVARSPLDQAAQPKAGPPRPIRGRSTARAATLMSLRSSLHPQAADPIARIHSRRGGYRNVIGRGYIVTDHDREVGPDDGRCA